MIWSSSPAVSQHMIRKQHIIRETHAIFIDFWLLDPLENMVMVLLMNIVMLMGIPR